MQDQLLVVLVVRFGHDGGRNLLMQSCVHVHQVVTVGTRTSRCRSVGNGSRRSRSGGCYGRRSAGCRRGRDGRRVC